MRDPVVSFVVPCYKLAHLLPECIDSILAQTYGDFEVLIMDDCSPDSTEEVVKSIKDPRVKYVRNDPNLGSIRNYNKGISLAKGQYIWLISADDVLRRNYVLERYVDLLEKNPRVGYTFCSGVGLRNGVETGVLEYAAYSERDEIIKGHTFLRKLLKRNIVLAPSVLVRRECYDAISLYPTDEGMIFSCDWWVWCIFAFYYDVAYFAEPMICYRQHELSMTTTLTERSPESLSAGRLVVPWKMMDVADEAGEAGVSKRCLSALGPIYGAIIANDRSGCVESAEAIEQFEAAITEKLSSEKRRNWLRARVYAAMASAYKWQGEKGLAKKYYKAGLEKNPWMLDVRIKKWLLWFGRFGDYHLLRRTSCW